MKFICLLYITCAAATASCHAQSVRGDLAEIAIIDRDTGARICPQVYRGEYWVAGKPGDRYAVEVRNRLGERLLAVISIDGVNIVSGQTAAWDQSGYVLDPGEHYQITGWRKSDAQVAAFTFTDAPNSYASLTGRPANVGLIGVAVFRELKPPAPPAVFVPPGAYVPPPASQPVPRPSAEDRASSRSFAAAQPRAMLPTPQLGTGHGEREYEYAVHTEFLRMQTQPNEVMRIHYDSFDNLVALGVIPRQHRPPPANPFPGSSSPGYVPDPPG